VSIGGVSENGENRTLSPVKRDVETDPKATAPHLDSTSYLKRPLVRSCLNGVLEPGHCRIIRQDFFMDGGQWILGTLHLNGWNDSRCQVVDINYSLMAIASLATNGVNRIGVYDGRS